MSRHSQFVAVLIASFVMLPACARQSDAPVAGGTAPDARPADAAIAADATAVPEKADARVAIGLPPVVVHKNASCGCCGNWVEHMRKAGFSVEVRDEDDLNAIEERLGVPAGKGSCHTAEIGGYVIEGHVPADDIKRLLAERPDARGLVLPGMPTGSPGMEAPDGRVQPYTVELVQRDGGTVPYAAHGQ